MNEKKRSFQVNKYERPVSLNVQMRSERFKKNTEILIERDSSTNCFLSEMHENCINYIA